MHFIVSLFFQSRRLLQSPVRPPCPNKYQIFPLPLSILSPSQSMNRFSRPESYPKYLAKRFLFHDILLHRLSIANRSLPTYFDLLALTAYHTLQKSSFVPPVFTPSYTHPLLFRQCPTVADSLHSLPTSTPLLRQAHIPAHLSEGNKTIKQ